jgi:uncharacterized membrane protein YjjP (DUF1212 family)
MSLDIQIVSFVFSFFYGIFFEILLELNSRIIYSSNWFIKIIGSFIFVIFNCLLYFLVLLKINNGILHIYFFLCILAGYTFMCKVRRKIFKRRGKNVL